MLIFCVYGIVTPDLQAEQLDWAWELFSSDGSVPLDGFDALLDHRVSEGVVAGQEVLY
ncbi:hypothetical protein KSB_46450 [Ktedonobacter robiniae]|uniref:Uncharacterized protein n=1 Tax=Ktedonobacter robiniae TaxID=2778365 RepID=A0ABQ3UV09_9CHLR|nr:hypothetical protein KSB_46450 [Ktedonobacter robiniae]